MTDKKSKKYKDYEKSTLYELDLYSNLGGIYEKDRDKYSGTVELYDLVPKYFYGDMEKERTKEGFLKIFAKTFIYRKQEIRVEISPANIMQKDGSTKSFYPSYREEIIEDVLRKFATDNKKNEVLDNMVSVKFTLHELYKELKRNKHEYHYQEIRESLDILAGTGIKIKYINNTKNILRSNMFETYGEVDENVNLKDDEYINEEQSKKIVYFVRFNTLVTKSIKEKTWRLINYEKCMSYRCIVSRYLHKRISHLFLIGRLEIPYNILLSTLINDSNVTKYDSMRNNVIRIKRALDEMKEVGSIDQYKLEYIYSKERKNKIEDVKILLWISKSFHEDIQKGFLLQNNQQKSLENNDNDTDTIITQDNNKLIPDNTIIAQKKDEIKNLIKKIDENIKETDINKITNNKTEQELSTIKENILGAKHYINKLKSENSDYIPIAIIREFIKNNWKTNDKDRQMELSLENKNTNKIEKSIDEIISGVENETYKEISRKAVELFGKKIYANWFLPLELAEITTEKLILSTASNFIKDQIEKEYMNGAYKDVNGENVLFRKGFIHIVRDVCPSIEDVKIIIKK
jgi:hypothetical protein